LSDSRSDSPISAERNIFSAKARSLSDSSTSQVAPINCSIFSAFVAGAYRLQFPEASTLTSRTIVRQYASQKKAPREGQGCSTAGQIDALRLELSAKTN
jgi:hypothetical protein